MTAHKYLHVTVKQYQNLKVWDNCGKYNRIQNLLSDTLSIIILILNLFSAMFKDI